MKTNLKTILECQNYHAMRQRLVAFEKELREQLKEDWLESEKIAKAIKETEDIFKASKEIGTRSVYWIQGRIFAIKEILGDDSA